jgi:hypothetical protein
MTRQVESSDSGDLVTISVRLTRDTADALKAVADRNYRPVAAHMRMLIESDIAADTDRLAA